MVAAALSRFELRKKALVKQELDALTGDELVRQTGVSPAQLPVDAADAQGLVFRGYGSLRACCYPLLRIEHPAKARGFLRQLADRVSPGVPAAREQAIHVALTYPGLQALRLPQELLEQFSSEFIAGMVGDHRSRFLGDVHDSAPENWQWGGPRNEPVHMLLLLFARDGAGLTRLLGELRDSWSEQGLREVRVLETNPAMLGREHFGFADGISQPAIDGYHPASSELHRIKAGEFLLGYENEYGLYTERPLLDAPRDPFGLLPLDVEGTPRHDFGRNGTYLVFRQLHQNVQAFDETLDRLATEHEGAPSRRAREHLAAKMVGRWPSGTSLIEAPDLDEPSKARNNDFRYHASDPAGLKCPIAAHVRRANPRDALDPRPGSDRSLEINRRHRLIRRGRAYGPPAHDMQLGGDGMSATGALQQERGLMFIAINANISRQFEFIQHSWLLDPHFNGLNEEADPLLSALPGNVFEAPENPLRMRCTGLPRFVTVAGGAYFFLPGLRALRYLAHSGPWVNS